MDGQKNSFGFFHEMLWKNPNKLLGNSIIQSLQIFIDKKKDAKAKTELYMGEKSQLYHLQWRAAVIVFITEVWVLAGL